MSLALIRMKPDVEVFSKWAAHKRFLPDKGDDLGYALHAALTAALGASSPKPFYWRTAGDPAQTLGSPSNHAVELMGYVGASAQAFLEDSRIADGGADLRGALGLDSVEARDMPDNWREGRALSFECRVRPIIRQSTDQTATGATGKKRHREVDAAVAAWAVAERANVGAPERPSKEEAYGSWLGSRLQNGGARLDSCKIISSRRTRVLRRPKGGDGVRRAQTIEGPDAIFRGRLTIADPGAFASMLAAGVGRHRGFGFGMLMIAPPGALA